MADAFPGLGAFGPYVAILLAAALPTHVWRWLGVALAGRLDEGSEILSWVRCVATAMVAAVIAQLVLFPSGPLAEVAPLVRVLAAAIGLAAFVALRGRLIAGILAAEAVLFAGFLLTVP